MGIYIVENKGEAIKWYRKAAEQGDPDAQFHLGLCYDEGCGVPENKAEAIKWFQKAAEQGHAWGIEFLEDRTGSS